jgi:uncharacterized protein
MLAVLSPAKSLNFSRPPQAVKYSLPEFIKEAEGLVKLLRKYSPADLSSLMGISAKLADLNFERFVKWDKNHNSVNSKEAVFAFNGDVYDGLDAYSLNDDNLLFLNQHVRILSGLYGVLCPFDLINEYRLEMGSKLQNKQGNDLYAYWGNKIALSVNSAIENSSGEKVLINLASNEYFKSINLKELKYPVITPVFKEFKDNEFQLISFFAKKARGLMTRYIATEKITEPQQLKFFNLGGYAFNQELSKNDSWVFTR